MSYQREKKTFCEVVMEILKAHICLVFVLLVADAYTKVKKKVQMMRIMEDLQERYVMALVKQTIKLQEI